MKPLDAVSFRTVNDLVIDQIDEATSKLQSIDTSQLNDLLKTALSTALALLPDEALFTSLRNELVTQFNDNVINGAIQVVSDIQTRPAQLESLLQNYSPSRLLGDSLSVPFQALISTLESFSPVQLLDPIEDQLETLREEIKRNASPALLIEPLEAPFQEFLALVDQLNPAVLVEPVQEAIDTVIDKIFEFIPVNDFFDLVDEVLQAIQGVIDKLDAVKRLIEALRNSLSAIANSPDAQVDAWIAQILNKLDELPPGTDLSPAFTALQQALDQTKAAGLTARLIPELTAFVQELTGLTPQDQLNDLIVLRQDLARQDTSVFPSSFQSDLQQFLQAFQPLDQVVNQPLTTLAELLQELDSQPQELTNWLANWDQLYHHPTAPLSQLIPSDTSISGVKQLLQTAIDETVRAPFTHIFRLAPKFSDILGDLLSPVDLLLTNLNSKITGLLTGPASLTTIKTALEDLVDIIRNINLDFLEDELNGVFDNIKEKLEALNPATILQELSTAFDAIVDELSLSSILPQTEVDALNAAYQQAVDTLKALDPEELVIKVVEPEFEAAIQPYLEAFDLTQIFDSLMELLNRLSSELDTELNRTQQSFSAMLRAVPLSSNTGVSASI